MKILIIPSWYPAFDKPLNGIFFQEQAAALHKTGHEVIIAYSELISLKQIFSKNNISKGLSFTIEDGLFTYRYRGYKYIPFFKIVSGVLHVYRVNKIFNKVRANYGIPDIIHAHSCIWGGYAAAKISKRFKIPFVIAEHSSDFLENKLDFFLRFISRKVFNSSSLVIAVGPGLYNVLNKYTDQRTILIPNMININKFKINRSKVIETGPFIFFSLGFLTEIKGMDVVIKAFSKLAGMDATLVIGGDGEEMDALKNLASKLGVKNKVKFLGSLNRDEVAEHMNRCNAFVLASRFETFGIVLIEALACGKPVIATACGGPEIIVNNDNGYLVPVNDSESLADAMKKMISSCKDFNPEVIRNDCIARFGENAIIERINKEYKKVLRSMEL